jgi:hypothetical protein
MFSKPTNAPEPLLRRDGKPFANVKGLPDIHPLLLWRAQPARAFGFGDVAALRPQLQATTLLHEPKWRDPVRGDPVAAVGIAVTMFPIDRVTPRTDFVMSALCLNALLGSAGSALVLAHVLNFLGLDDPSLRPLGASWSPRNQVISGGSPRSWGAAAGSGTTIGFRGMDGIDGTNLKLRLGSSSSIPMASPRPEIQSHSSKSVAGS